LPELRPGNDFWDVAVDQKTGSIRDAWNCPGCGTRVAKSPRQNSGALRAERAWETRYDRELKQTIRQAKQVPVLINYTVGKKRFEKTPDAADRDLIRKIEESDIPYPVPVERMPEGSESRRNDDIGLTHVHHFYTKRNLWVISVLHNNLDNFTNQRFQKLLISILNSVNNYINKNSRLVVAVVGFPELCTSPL